MKNVEELIKFGIINIDKPSGPTSFSVSHYIMKSLGINKTSHLGTLDPQVTGVLPVALGRACRLNDFLMHKNKTYIGIMRLHTDVSDDELQRIIKKFLGKIKQMPPVKSRVKRAIREREILSFKVIEKENKDVLFETEVQAGTYIRKLCDDIGKEIGGAHMLELRRIRAGYFDEKNSFTLYDFDKAVEEYKKGDEEELKNMIIPAEKSILQVMPAINVKKNSIKKLLTGKPLMKSDLIENLPEKEIFAIFDDDKLISINKKTDEKDIVARPLFVVN